VTPVPDTGSGRVHLVTGATGFVGAALVLELLAQTPDEVACLVRPSDDSERARTRLSEALKRACELYECPELLAQVEARCHAVPFDLREVGDGAPAGLPEGIAEVWHAAASLRFKQAQRKKILEQNVEGTRRMLQLSTAIGASTFNFISTAYVAGKRTGVILEEPASDPSVAHNAYEESKIEAEILVDKWDGIRTRIMRPSIVIGHSGTFASTSHAGFYGFILGVQRTRKEVMDRKLGDFLVHRSIRLLGDGETAINLIPVDLVARNAVGISRSSSDAGVFHLVNATPPQIAEVGHTVCSVVGTAPPIFVSSTEEFTLIDRKLDEQPRTEFFRSYLTRNRIFDLTNTNAALGEDASTIPLEGDALAPYIEWYLDMREELRDVRQASLPASA
jgi:nucleoside-diphosphate-sugar epimerase